MKTTNNPNAEMIANYNLQPHFDSEGDLHWIMPNSAPSWNEVGDISDFTMWIGHALFSEKGWLDLATGDIWAAGAVWLVLILAVSIAAIGFCFVLGKLFKRAREAVRLLGANGSSAVNAYALPPKKSKRGATPRKRSAVLRRHKRQQRRQL